MDCDLFVSSLPKKLQKQLLFITDYLRLHTTRAYIVGGAIRDYFLCNDIFDIDIEIYGISPEQFDKIMQDIGAKSVGKSFFVYKYEDIDLALARSERQTSNHHRGFEVFVEDDEQKACIRRDFKMNSIMLHLFTYKVLDIFDGIKDIKQKQVSIIDEARFKEDPLRVLRAMQFCARFGFLCNSHSVEVMQNMDLSNISTSRIFVELEKLFSAPYLHIGWLYMVKLGVFKKIFNIDITHKQFSKIYFLLKQASMSYEDTTYNFYFLYIIFSVLRLNKKLFFKNNIFPNNYKKLLIKQVSTPKDPSDKFLIALSLKYPLKEWLGCMDGGIQQKAIRLGVYHNSFVPTISISDIIDMGYRGKDIKRKFKTLSYSEIKSL